MVLPVSPAAATATIGTDATDVVVIYVADGAERITVNVASAAGSASLSEFKVYARTHPGAAWIEYALTDPVVVENYDTALSTLAASANQNLVLNPRGWNAIKLTAKVAANTAALTSRYTQA